MTGTDSSSRPVSRKVLAIVVVLATAAILAVLGLMYSGILLPGQTTVPPAPENTADAGTHQLNCNTDDLSPDNATCCYCRFNLQEENRENLRAPTVVDINEATGNLLVRGPMPLTIRNGAGNPPATYGCKNENDWSFAYDNLSRMIRHESTSSPAYFTSGKTAALQADLAGFNLADYEIIVISLVDNGDVDSHYLNIEKRDFGQKSSTCSEPLAEGTIHGQPASLLISTTGFCNAGDPDNSECQQYLTMDVNGYCSYANLISRIDTLMSEKSSSGKKRLIYYHCVLGTDRTGGVTMGYLMKASNLSYADALTYTTYLGKDSGTPHAPNLGSRTLAKAYCNMIHGTCSDTRVAAALTPAETVTTAVPTTAIAKAATLLPAQTAVSGARYTPGAGGATF